MAEWSYNCSECRIRSHESDLIAHRLPFPRAESGPGARSASLDHGQEALGHCACGQWGRRQTLPLRLRQREPPRLRPSQWAHNVL